MTAQCPTSCRSKGSIWVVLDRQLYAKKEKSSADMTYKENQVKLGFIFKQTAIIVSLMIYFSFKFNTVSNNVQLKMNILLKKQPILLSSLNRKN